MNVDFACLHELLDATPTLRGVAGQIEDGDLAAAESVVGFLPASYRSWALRTGGGSIGGEPIATVAPREFAADATDVITEPWRQEPGRLCFHQDADGASYWFVSVRSEGAEAAVIRRHTAGAEEPFADSFAGFLSVMVAAASGLGEGPTPAVAQVWRSTPGTLRGDGTLVYGPHAIQERNRTYEVADYAPTWVLVGDDSGGSGLFMRRHGADRDSVYRLDLGAIDDDVAADGEFVTSDLVGWLGTL